MPWCQQPNYSSCLAHEKRMKSVGEIDKALEAAHSSFVFIISLPVHGTANPIIYIVLLQS
jgi:hypothetical protein